MIIAAMITPGIHPFWFWNTAMDEARIRAQLRALADGGCRGALIHPRQGYPGGYLSARWRELVACAVREGAALGLEIGACDEFPYPSGNAGGLAGLGHPERWACDLRQHCREVDGGPVDWQLPPGAVLDCAAFPIAAAVDWTARRDLAGDVGVAFRQETYRESERDLSAYNGRRYFACDPAPRLETALPPGRWLLVASLQCVDLHHKYVGPWADTLDPDAMGAVIAVTCGRYAGIPLHALFVDEIEAAAWSRHLPTWYRERHGEDIAPLLPALVRDDHPRAAALRADLAAIRAERFRRAFLDPMRAWCHAHGVVMCEERGLHSLAEAGADLPGCDPGHTRVGAPRIDMLGTELRRNARAAAAAGHGTALCECGHSLGWGGTLEDYRLIIDNLLLNGITHLVPHGAFASTAALRKHDAPPSFFIQQAWWPLHHLLAARVERILQAFADRPIEPELLVPPGTSEDVQHALMARGHIWSFADDAPPCHLDNLPPPRLAPWSDQPLVHRMVRGDRALLVNNARSEAVVRLPIGWSPLPLDGAAPAQRDGGWVLEPAQALLAAHTDATCVAVPQVDLPWPQRWSVHAPGGNLLRLGTWELTIDGRSAATSHFPLSEQLRRTGLAISPRIDPGFGTPTAFALPDLRCRYSTVFQREHDAPLRLLMEPETLVDAGWTVQINDGPALGSMDCTPTNGLPDEALGLDVTPWLRPGANRIVIELTTARADGGLRNPLYLHGDIGVLPEVRIVAPIDTAPFGDVRAAALPYACGTITWEADAHLPVAPEAALIALHLPQLAIDAYEFALDDGPWLAVPWAPRRVLLPPWQAGRHRLRVRQHLPLAHCFHGEGWDATAHSTISIG
jgi:hypothetical protein